jgi:hypothetical protein
VQQDHPVVAVGRLLYRRAQGQRLGPAEQATIQKANTGAVRVAALRYAMIAAKGHVLANSLTWGTERVRGETSFAGDHRRAEQNLRARNAQRLARPVPREEAPDYLDAMVLRHLTGGQFASALRPVLRNVSRI